MFSPTLKRNKKSKFTSVMSNGVWGKEKSGGRDKFRESGYNTNVKGKTMDRIKNRQRVFNFTLRIKCKYLAPRHWIQKTEDFILISNCVGFKLLISTIL